MDFFRCVSDGFDTGERHARLVQLVSKLEQFLKEEEHNKCFKVTDQTNN
jgi:hypothetical protein